MYDVFSRTMLITTENKCSFSLYYRIPSNCEPNDNLWGYVRYEDSNVQRIKDAYEQYIWIKLLNNTPNDQFKNKTPYNQYTQCEYEGDEFFDDENTDEEEDEGMNESYRLFLLDSLNSIQKHKKCVDAAYTIMKKEGYDLEPFQKSVLLEHLFFFVSENDPGILYSFIAAMYPYFCFDSVMINHVIRMYSKKHYVSIIPRRHGKTMTIYMVIASFLISYGSISILAIAQNKKLINTTKKRITQYLEFWNSTIEPGCLSYSLMSTTDNVLVSYKKYPSKKSLLQCASVGQNDQASRGPDPDFAIIDETMCINPNRFNSILALGQKKKCKLGFLSSPTPESKDRILKFITHLTKSRSGSNFYFVNYFCGSLNHTKYSSSQVGCVDLMFYKPRHITFSEENKTLTDIMTRNTQCYEGELGIIKDYEIENALREEEGKENYIEDFKSFRNSFYEFLKSPECVCYDSEIVNYFIYLDPAFCSTTQSGIGIACCALNKDNLPTLCYFNHRFLEINELTDVNGITVRLLISCIDKLRYALGEDKFLSFFIAIEHNNFLYNVASIYKTLKTIRNPYYDIYLYHTTASILKKNMKLKDEPLLPGYCMTGSKKGIVNEVLTKCNRNELKISAYMPCQKIRGIHPIPYLLDQCRSFKWLPNKNTWSGKLTRETSDDLVIAAIMSIYFAMRYGMYTLEFKGKSKIPPWQMIEK